MSRGAVLDTHVLIHWRSDPARLTQAQRECLEGLEGSGGRFTISAITLWEVAKLAQHQKISVTRPLDLFLGELEDHPRIEVVPLSGRILAESVQLGNGFHKDPADQIIAATARCLGYPLVTQDQRIRDWGGVSVV